MRGYDQKKKQGKKQKRERLSLSKRSWAQTKAYLFTT
jgi:hypothetical protein